MVPILILAAGQSSRMRGSDKLAEEIGGVPLLRLQALRALGTGAPVFVALPAIDHPRCRFLDGLPVTRVIVPDAQQGMGVTLREVVAALPLCDAFLIMLADLVALDTGDLLTVLGARHDFPDDDVWRGATQTGKPGHPILFDAAMRPAFARLTGDQGGGILLKDPNVRVRSINLPGARALLDLDTPEAWAAWRLAQTDPAK